MKQAECLNRSHYDGSCYLHDGDAPYIAVGRATLRVVWTLEVPVAAADQYWRVYLNPTTFAAYPIPEAAYILYHELSHVLSRDAEICRGMGADPKLYNVAADLRINCSKWARMRCPANGVTVEQFGFPPGLLSPEYYQLLVEQAEKQAQKEKGQGQGEQGELGEQGEPDETEDGSGEQEPSDENADEGTDDTGSGEGGEGGEGDETPDADQSPGHGTGDGDEEGQGEGDGQGSGQSNGEGTPGTGSGQGQAQAEPSDPGHGAGSASDGVSRPWELAPDNPDAPGLKGAEEAAARMAVAAAIREYEATQGRGSIGGDWGLWAENTLSPVIPWTSKLRAVASSGLSKIGLGSQSYSRVRERNGVCLPRHVRRVPVVAIVADTSGSMGSGRNTPWHRALSECIGIAKAIGTVTVVWCDAAASIQRNVRNLSDVKPVGTGGTDMGVGIAAADALRGADRPDVIITLTDGDTSWPATPPKARHLAVIVKRGYQGPAWGETVYAWEEGRRR